MHASQAVACGENVHGECNIPELEPGASFVQVAGGFDPMFGSGHTVLLRIDGRAVACGDNHFGRGDLPELEPGACYAQVAAGGKHTGLLRSDGRAVECGDNKEDHPELEPGETYITSGITQNLLVQLLVERRGQDITVVARNLLTGDALATWAIAGEALQEPAMPQACAELTGAGMRLRVVQPDGALLSEKCTWEELSEQKFEGMGDSARDALERRLGSPHWQKGPRIASTKSC